MSYLDEIQVGVSKLNTRPEYIEGELAWKTAYEQGRQEFYKGYSVARSPYPEGTEQYIAWWQGYEDAYSLECGI